MIRPLTVVLALAGLLAACGEAADVTGGPAPPQTPYRFGTLRMGHWGMGPIREAEEEEEFRQAMKKRYGGTE